MIANARQRKKRSIPRVHSAVVMLSGWGSTNTLLACMVPEMVKASQSCVYEEMVVPRLMFSIEMKAVVCAVRD